MGSLRYAGNRYAYYTTYVPGVGVRRLYLGAGERGKRAAKVIERLRRAGKSREEWRFYARTYVDPDSMLTAEPAKWIELLLSMGGALAGEGKE